MIAGPRPTRLLPHISRLLGDLGLGDSLVELEQKTTALRQETTALRQETTELRQKNGELEKQYASARRVALASVTRLKESIAALKYERRTTASPTPSTIKHQPNSVSTSDSDQSVRNAVELWARAFRSNFNENSRLLSKVLTHISFLNSE